jgi:arylsulfatase A-like enzyme
MKSNKTFSIVSSLFALLVCGDVLHAAQPNVVLFLVDDMGWMDTSAYGSEYYETPHMKRLASQAMRFTDAYATPLCSPTRASILTGQYSSRHGITSASGHRPAAEPGAAPYPEKAPPNRPLIYANSKNYLDPKLTTLAEVLRDAGYRTGHFGKWHLGLMPQYWPEEQGFETAWHCAPDPGPPSYFSPYGVARQGVPTGRQKVGNITDGPVGEYITDRLTDEALKFIETHRDEAFFLNLWHYGVHGPWGHKERYTAEFAKKSDPRGEQRNPIMASMLKSVDESLGRVLAKLDELGLTEDTLFIFYSDNGGNTHSNVPGTPKTDQAERAGSEMLKDWRKWAGSEPPTNNAPLREGKGRIYEGGTRVPLMVRWPGKIKACSTSDAVVGAIDLYPTILDAIGLKRPNGHMIDGLSFLPVLQQTGPLQRDAYFTWFPHLIPAVSVRYGDWKLLRRFEPHRDYPDLLELYNLREDLGETTNLAAKMPDKVKQLDALIDTFIKDTGALAPIPNRAFNERAISEGKTPREATTGLVPRMCKISLVAAALRVEADGRTPFLGTAQVRQAGPVTLKLRARTTAGGIGRVQWRTADQEEFPAEGQAVEYILNASDDWQDVSIDLPVQGRTGIVRLYLPAQRAPVEIESIRFTPTNSTRPVRVWNFATAK